MQIIEIPRIANDRRSYDLSPGQFISERMEMMGWSQEQLAQVLDITPKYLNDILNHRKGMNPDLIIKISVTLGLSYTQLMAINLEYELQNNQALKKEKEDVERKAFIANMLPYHEFVKKGWVTKASTSSEMEQNLISFYEINNFTDLENKIKNIQERRNTLSALRQSNTHKRVPKEESLIAWLASAQLFAKKQKTPKYNVFKAQEILDNIASYTTDEIKGIKKFIDALNGAGIKFLMLPHLPQTYVDGAALLDSSDDSRLIVFSGRYDRIDHFWFTVAHELVHIIKHLNTEDYFIADSLDNEISQQEDREKEANSIASEKLLIYDIIKLFEEKEHLPLEKRVLECAMELQIHKAVVAGLMAFHYNKNVGYKPISYHHLSLFSGKVKEFIPKEYKRLEQEQKIKKTE